MLFRSKRILYEQELIAAGRLNAASGSNVSAPEAAADIAGADVGNAGQSVATQTGSASTVEDEKPMQEVMNRFLEKHQGKKNAKGETISGTKKKAKIKAINSAVDDDLTTYQKKALYRIFNVD